ncbi:MAG: hypothetical protein EGQ30_04105, partial [Clostridiales bacterium]|nr:hypothetical protein [Clostridiales bacterium]
RTVSLPPLGDSFVILSHHFSIVKCFFNLFSSFFFLFFNYPSVNAKATKTCEEKSRGLYKQPAAFI